MFSLENQHDLKDHLGGSTSLSLKKIFLPRIYGLVLLQEDQFKSMMPFNKSQSKNQVMES